MSVDALAASDVPLLNTVREMVWDPGLSPLKGHTHEEAAGALTPHGLPSKRVQLQLKERMPHDAPTPSESHTAVGSSGSPDAHALTRKGVLGETVRLVPAIIATSGSLRSCTSTSA